MSKAVQQERRVVGSYQDVKKGLFRSACACLVQAFEHLFDNRMLSADAGKISSLANGAPFSTRPRPKFLIAASLIMSKSPFFSSPPL